MDRSSDDYKKAFDAYLRHGLMLAPNTKAAPTTSYYIWRTRKDGKARPSHVANDGKIFSWNNPPATGHPGQAPRCRCRAEPFPANITEYVDINFSGVADTGNPWTSEDFINHYYKANGRAVRLREIGHLQAVVSEFRRQAIDDISRLPSQIANLARKIKNGSFNDIFSNSYQMQGVVFSIGDTTIKGNITGQTQEKYGVLEFSGNIDFSHYDEFVDPLDIGVEAIDPQQTILENLIRPTDRRVRQGRIPFVGFQGIYKRDTQRDNLGIHTGEKYDISDSWSGTFYGRIHLDKKLSIYNGK